MKKHWLKQVIAALAAAAVMMGSAGSFPVMASQPAASEEEAETFETMSPNSRANAYYLKEDQYYYGYADDKKEVWMKFTPQESGYYEFSTYSGHGDNCLYVYEGNGTSPVTYGFGSYEGSELKAAAYLTAGKTYQFFVKSYTWDSIDFEVIVTRHYFNLNKSIQRLDVYEDNALTMTVDPFYPSGADTTGTSMITYQWYKYSWQQEDYQEIAGATKQTYKAPAYSYDDDTQHYKCVVTNGIKTTEGFVNVDVHSMRYDIEKEVTIKPGQTVEIGPKNIKSLEGGVQNCWWEKVIGDPLEQNYELIEGEENPTMKLRFNDMDSDVEYYRVTFYDGLTGECEFIKVKKLIEDVAVVFNDVSTTSWFHDAVQFVYENGIMTGMNATTFGPANKVSRAQFVTMLHRIAGAPTCEYDGRFKDVSKGTWYTEPVAFAIESGVSSGGYGNGMFGPADSITREQMAVMLRRFAYFMGYKSSASVTTDINSFPDANKMSTFAKEAMEWAIQAGLISGKEDAATGAKYLDPQGKTSRAEVAMIIMRFYNNFDIGK